MSPIDRAAYVARIEYTKGLRALADAIDNNLDLPLPYQSHELTFFIHNDIGQVLALHALMTDPVLTRESGHFAVKISGKLAGFSVDMYVADDLALTQPPATPMFPPLIPALAALIDETFRDEPSSVPA